MPYSAFVCLLITVYPACRLWREPAAGTGLGLWGAIAHSAQREPTSGVGPATLRPPLSWRLGVTNLEAFSISAPDSCCL